MGLSARTCALLEILSLPWRLTESGCVSMEPFRDAAVDGTFKLVELLFVGPEPIPGGIPPGQARVAAWAADCGGRDLKVAASREPEGRLASFFSPLNVDLNTLLFSGLGDREVLLVGG